jgi:hypothetical protein
LVNTGYSDVITPNNLDTCAVKCNTADAQTFADLGYTAYDRSFLTPSVSEPFLSVNPLTPAEWAQVPGDVVRALYTGFKDVFIPSSAATPPASVTAKSVAVLPNPAPKTEVADVVAAAEAPDVAAVSPVAAPRKTRDANAAAPQSRGGAVRHAASQVKAALTPKRAAATRSAAR